MPAKFFSQQSRNIFGMLAALLIVGILRPDFVLAEESNFIPQALRSPESLIESVAKVEVNLKNKDTLTVDQSANYRSGSGFFVDFTGCLLTNAHVFVDTSTEKVAETIEIALPKNYRKKPEVVGKARVTFWDLKIDTAILCLDATHDFYPELEIATAEEVERLSLTDPLKIIGFPRGGSDSITYAQGQVIGFWDDPDLKQVGGAHRIDSKQVNLIKMDAVTGAGGSGSPLLNKDNKVVGVLFAAQVLASIPGLAISSKTFADWRDKVKTVPAKDCFYDPLFGLYSKNQQYYYDAQCLWQRDLNLEYVVGQNFVDRCGGSIEEDTKRRAAEHIKKGSSIEKWFNYLKKICPYGPKIAAKALDPDWSTPISKAVVKTKPALTGEAARPNARR